jgi:SAM-dependent methyltransferase
VKWLRQLKPPKPADAFRSGAYWTERYERGRTSGSGSYGRLAAYKADHVNALVTRLGVTSVLEFGSGDGNQAALFDFADYTGVDVSPLVVKACHERFADRPGWRFLTTEDVARAPLRADMTLSLDVVYHLVEDAVFDAYMQQLCASAERYVLIYASDHEAATANPHVRHRAYSDWMAASAPDFRRKQSWDHPFPMRPGSDPEVTSFAFFRLFERQDGIAR